MRIERIRIGNLWLQQLDRSWPFEHPVFGLVHDAHCALAELALEVVLAEALNLADLSAKPVNDVGGQG